MKKISKKIVILGGGDNQLPLIVESKKLGYYVVLCDFREINPGREIADIHYVVNTLNYDEVLSVCQKENPDGIITNSEPAIPVMTKVASQLGLVGNPESAVDSIISKSKFRSLQAKLGLFCPKHMETNSIEEVYNALKIIKYPIIIKPCECSGSRGTKRINSFDKELIDKTFNECKKLSRNGLVALEEFVLMPSLTTIEGDVFVKNDHIIWDGLFYTTRASYAPMVPMTYSIPLYIDTDKIDEIKKVLSTIFRETGIVHGEYNIEGYFNEDGNFFVIEINPRQGGHGIPDFIKDATGIDFTKLLVSTAVGDDSYWESVQSSEFHCKNIIKHVAYSDKDGEYDGLKIDEEIQGNIVNVTEMKRRFEHVDKCINGTSLVAIVDMLFNDKESQLKVYDRLEELVQVMVK